MQTHSDHGSTFQALPYGQPFRFYHRSEAAIGLKARFGYGNGGDAALVLTTTKTGLQSGDLVSADDVGNVVELAGAKVVPTTEPQAIAAGAGNIAEPGEIELHNGGLIFVTKPQAGAILRVDVQSGTIGFASGIAPVEIYSEWSVIRETETLYAHKPMLSQGESVTMEID